MLDIINNNNVFNVPHEGYTRYDATNDSFDTIDFVFITQNLVILTSSITTEIDIPSDHPFLYFELRLDNTSASAIEIITKLYHKANWNNINYIIYKNR